MTPGVKAKLVLIANTNTLKRKLRSREWANALDMSLILKKAAAIYHRKEIIKKCKPPVNINRGLYL